MIARVARICISIANERFGMSFDLISLRALSAIVREGAFDAAADALGLTQPAISQRIKALEERVGAQLIIRGRPCVATRYGQILSHLADQISFLEYDAQRALDELGVATANGPTVLRIAVNADSIATWFPQVILRARKELGVFLDLVSHDQTITAKHLASGEVVAAITTETLAIPGSTLTPLGSMEYAAIAAPGFVGAYFPKGVTSVSLRQAPTLHYDSDDGLPGRWALQAVGDASILRGHSVPSYGGYLACCLGGAGWGLMPIASVRGHLKAGDLVDISPHIHLREPLFWHVSARRSKLLGLLADIVSQEARGALATVSSVD